MMTGPGAIGRAGSPPGPWLLDGVVGMRRLVLDLGLPLSWVPGSALQPLGCPGRPDGQGQLINMRSPGIWH